MSHVFTGFGFGPIQAGLFVSEAYTSRNFERIVIAEIDQLLVDAICANNGSYSINIAGADGIKVINIKGIEIYSLSDDQDRVQLLDALRESTEICTSLPSVNFYDTGRHSVVSLIAQGLKDSTAKATIIYTAENNNHAAEILEQKVKAHSAAPFGRPVQFLNTVIGKMSQVVVDPAEIEEKKLQPIAPGLDRAFLVEAFNKILATRCNLESLRPGIEVFVEKENLLPFEEAKLYGHNAIHALLAYLGAHYDCKKMTELVNHQDIMMIARNAFLNESGAALCRKYAALGDPLFTESGFRDYAEDLLTRMTNPWLDDTVERAARDPQRKLSLNDRIFGTMSLCLEQHIMPQNIAKGAAAGVVYFMKQNGLNPETVFKETLTQLWNQQTNRYDKEIMDLTILQFQKNHPKELCI